MQLRLFSAILLWATLTGGAWAAPAGFIVRIEGPRIVINRGALDSVKVGDHFTVLRQGRNIAEVVVQNVGPQESQAVVSQVFGQESVLAGDALSISGAPPVPPTASVALNQSQGKPTTPMLFSAEETRQAYEEMLKARTQSKEFEQKWSGRAGITSDFNEYTWAGILDGLGYAFLPYGGWIGPVDTLLRTANMALLNHHLHDRMGRDYMARIEIEMVRWDNDLLEAYCRCQAAQSGMATAEEYQALRSQVIKEKGLDQNDVFQVRVRNAGELNVELAPFHWHIFLSAPEGKKVVASRYDPVLDRKLGPKQEVVGFVSFPKVADREEMTLLMEDIYGDQGEFTFSR